MQLYSDKTVAQAQKRRKSATIKMPIYELILFKKITKLVSNEVDRI